MARMNVTIAAKFIMPEFGLTQIQMGQVFGAFMLSYAIFQIPAGLLGDRFGPRSVLAVSGIAWGILTVLTGLLPGVLITSAAMVVGVLLAVRFLLGAAEAAMYPVAARAIATWIRAPQRALGNSIVVSGMAVGSACTPPLISWLMVHWGWRQALYYTAAVPVLLAIAWWKRVPGRNAYLQLVSGVSTDSPRSHRRWFVLLWNPNIWLISFSYFLESYVQYIFLFWFFLYLVDVRGFTLMKGGFLASLPYIISMAAMPTAGYLSDRLAQLWGKRRGRCTVVIVGFVSSALFLLIGAESRNAYVAAVAISLSVGLLLSTEGTFWSTVTDMSREHAGAAAGIMNTAGNLAGVASTALVPVIVQRHGWLSVFISSALLSIAGAAAWLLIRFREQPSTTTAPPVLSTEPQ
jgi:MFS transporter, ACS family, glucarate transporter